MSEGCENCGCGGPSSREQIPAGYDLATQLIHGQYSSSAWDFSHHLNPPESGSTTFRLESLRRGAEGFLKFAASDGDPQAAPILIYDRLDEPNILMLESRLALLEGAGCSVSFGSGMGAIATTLLALCEAGHKIIAHRTLYGCTYSLMTNWLPRLGVHSRFIDMNSTLDRAALADPKVRVVYFESLTNPNLEMIDLPQVVKEVGKLNRDRREEEKIYIVVDNTFPTPLGCRPLKFGADIVIQSLTKNLSGFGTTMGGAVMAPRHLEGSLKAARKDFGAVLNPKAAWHIMTYGLSTLTARVSIQQQNAMRVAEFLEKHPKVEKVIYPGLNSFPQRELAQTLLRSPDGEFAPGTMVSFTLKGDMDRCEKFVDHIASNSYAITLAVSLGVTKTLIEVPGFMTHAPIPKEHQETSGIDPRGIRLSLGLESSDDLIRDLEKSLETI
ncbi:MAG: PLP-dependent transferase [Bdellovibrionales bacterium]|nr:PLP-dependent transferase [Bdellovibrionales bacterium]